MKKAAHLIVALVLLGAGALLGRWYDAHFAGTESEAPRKPLYYRNPMGLPDTSPVPKKDSMGMDYIPVYAEDVAAAPAREMKGDVGTGNILRIPLEKVQKIGVRTEPAALREIKADVTAVGVIEADERSRVTIAPRFEGWIEKLHVNETGRAVHRGEPLFSAYSPELVAAQQEYLIALGAAQRGAGQLGDELLQTARTRLLNWQLSEGDIRTLESRREPMRTVTFRAPADGVVLEKTAETGMRFMPGEVLYRLADLHNVWLMASVYEQDIGDVRIGLPVNLQIDSFPSELFHGRVGFIYPTLDDATRTAKVRIELGNEDLRLRPGMYGRVTVQVLRHGGPVLSVPDSAVLDSGVRQLVLVERGEGMFEPRDVVIGVRGSGYVEIREGLADRERVVVSANFLIDAESNLRAAIDSFGHADHGSKPAGTDAAPVHEHGAPVEPAEHGGH